MSIKKYKELFSLKSIIKIEEFANEHNLDLNHENKQEEHLLLIKDDLNILKWLIEEKNLDINYTNKFGKNALFNASIKKTEYLISKGINIHQIDKAGKNALFYSDLDKSKILLKSGININELSFKKRNVAFGTINKDLLTLYVQYGINLNQRDFYGYGVFDSIGLYALGSDDEKVNFLNFLVSNGLDPTIKNNYKGENLLFHCVSKNFLKGALYLINEIKMDVNELNLKDENVLFYVNDVLIADQIVQLGGNIHQINKHGRNLLFTNNISLFKYYAAKNVNINQLDNDDLSIFSLDYKREIINYCLSKNMKQNVNKNIMLNALKDEPELLEKALKKYSKKEKQLISLSINHHLPDNNKTKRL